MRGSYNIKAALLLAFSAPFKLGTVHRFSPTVDFEKRLVEALVVFEGIELAFPCPRDFG